MTKCWQGFPWLDTDRILSVFFLTGMKMQGRVGYFLMTKSGRFLGGGVYEGWSFCRDEMSRGGGARPLHSFSCPSLNRRLRAGRGTPDSAWGWLRGFDTPLSRSEGWMPSCQHRGKCPRWENHREGMRRSSRVMLMFHFIVWSGFIKHPNTKICGWKSY